jgi:predicted transcriptional regulator
MAKEAVFTMKLEPELRDAFMAAAEQEDRPASQIVREMMRDYVDQHQPMTPDYLEFLRRKVERGLADVAAGRTHSSEEVEAYFAAKRAALRKNAGGNA